MTRSHATTVLVLFILAVLGFGLCPTAPGGTIYSDDFSGPGGTRLDGTVPDVAPAGRFWSAGAIWEADGAKPTSGDSNAFLPFRPQPGNVYTLSADVDPEVSGSDDWFALGFSQTNARNAGWHTSNSVYGWMLNRENDASGTAVQTFQGLGTAGAAGHDFTPDKVGPVNLQVVLDTQPANWTVEWFVDGTSIRAPVAYGTNPAINYAAVAGYGTSTGSVDNFRLTSLVDDPPMPGHFDFLPITNDADSGISDAKTYTHAIDFGTGAAVAVNNLWLRPTRIGEIPIGNLDYQVTSGGRNDHGGNSEYDVTGNVAELFRDMIYNGSNAPGGTATLSLTGLVPGTRYDTRLYVRQWGAGGNRESTVGFDIDNDGTFDNFVPINEDDARSVGFASDRQAYALSFRFRAESDQMNLSFLEALSNQSWHVYGLTNEIVEPAPGYGPVSGLVSADNHYQLYLSDDDSVLGTPIAQSVGDWASAETVGFLVPDGEQMYLHVVAQNDDPPNWGGLIAHFEVPSKYRILQTNGTVLETDGLLWMVNYTGFGNPMDPATAIGTYGVGPWGTGVNPDLPGTAQWIWMGGGQGQQAGTLYFSAPFTVLQIPEPGTLALLALGGLGLLIFRRRIRYTGGCRRRL
jgi:hypothetical protein